MFTFTSKIFYYDPLHIYIIKLGSRLPSHPSCSVSFPEAAERIPTAMNVGGARVFLLYRWLAHRSIRDEKLNAIRHALACENIEKRVWVFYRSRTCTEMIFVVRASPRALSYLEGSSSILSVDCLVGNITRRVFPIVIRTLDKLTPSSQQIERKLPKKYAKIKLNYLNINLVLYF